MDGAKNIAWLVYNFICPSAFSYVKIAGLQLHRKILQKNVEKDRTK
jgi:hypothetical protein